MQNSQVMVLTGCASGIGRHMVGVLLRRGHRVLATDIDEERLTRAAETDAWNADRLTCCRLDVRDPAAWRQVIDGAQQRWGRIDVLMNIAGYLRPGFVHQIPLEEVDRHVDVNVKGIIFGTQTASKPMVSQGRGHIINIGSLASLAPVPGLSLYSATKFAVRGFSLAAAQELRRHGVYVTVVLPDAVATPMLDLQVSYAEAAMTFSGTAPLTVADVEQAIIQKALPQRPMEITLPLGRGAMARLATVLPDLARMLGPVLLRRGRAGQGRYEGDESRRLEEED